LERNEPAKERNKKIPNSEQEKTPPKNNQKEKKKKKKKKISFITMGKSANDGDPWRMTAPLLVNSIFIFEYTRGWLFYKIYDLYLGKRSLPASLLTLSDSLHELLMGPTRTP
jgi:hypothetical protein